MKRLIILMIITVISVSLIALNEVSTIPSAWWNPMDTLYSFYNPIAGAFKNNLLDIETAYDSEESTLIYLVGSIGISTNIFNLYAAPSLEYPMILSEVLNGSIDMNEIPISIPVVASLKIANAIVVSANVNAMYFDGEFGIQDVPTIALGLGGESMSYKRYSAGALYYETSDLFILDSDGNITKNDDFDWKNGMVGIYGYSKGMNSESYFNLSVDLPIIDELSNENNEDSVNLILNSLTGDLIVSNSGLTLGGGWNRGSYYGLLGLDLKFLKILAESFGGNEMEFLKSFLIKAKITF